MMIPGRSGARDHARGGVSAVVLLAALVPVLALRSPAGAAQPVPDPLAVPGAADPAATRWLTALCGTLAIPTLHGGACFIGIAPNGHGVFADFKLTLSRPVGADNPLPLTAEEAEAGGDVANKSFENWHSLNVGYARRGSLPGISRSSLLYVGAGYARREVTRRFFHAGSGSGFTGNYWAIDSRETRNTVNVVAGSFIPIGHIDTYRVALQLAGESSPPGVVLGLGLLH